MLVRDQFVIEVARRLHQRIPIAVVLGGMALLTLAGAFAAISYVNGLVDRGVPCGVGWDQKVQESLSFSGQVVVRRHERETVELELAPPTVIKDGPAGMRMTRFAVPFDDRSSTLLQGRYLGDDERVHGRAPAAASS